MFDEFLQKHGTARGEPFLPFDLGADYRLYVDGKPRFDGVRDFLGHAELTYPKEIRTILPRPKQLPRSETARTPWSAGS